MDRPRAEVEIMGVHRQFHHDEAAVSALVEILYDLLADVPVAQFQIARVIEPTCFSGRLE